MSLDAEFTTSSATVGLASVNQLWCAARTRSWPGASDAWLYAAGRRRRRANRLMAAALLLTLALGAAATLAWADQNIQGTRITPYPPLLWPLVLFVTGIAVSILANALAGPGQRADGTYRTPAASSPTETTHRVGEMPSLFPGGGTETPVQAAPHAHPHVNISGHHGF